MLGLCVGAKDDAKSEKSNFLLALNVVTRQCLACLIHKASLTLRIIIRNVLQNIENIV